MTHNDPFPIQKKSPQRGVEVADILKRYGQEFLSRHPVTYAQKRIMENIMHCRTLAMGGHASKCNHCDHIEMSYNSCRNRHCPKCQSLNKARWLEDRVADLLPVSYVHGVFTLPHDLNPLILYNKKLLLDGFFKIVSSILLSFGRDKRNRLEGELGFTAVLHTWNQKLYPHYHLHCIIPSGVYRKNESRWVPTQYRFLFPVKALSEVLRGKMVSFCRKVFKKGKLSFPKPISHLEDPKTFSGLLSTLMEKNWVVYAKRPFKSPKFVLDYLGRYTHRVAISNNRILSMDDRIIRFTYKDRDKGYQTRICPLKADHFIKRFLCHELPSGFMRIRHFGFLGNAVKTKRLATIRSLLGARPREVKKDRKTTAQLMQEVTGIDIHLCPKCGKGRLKLFDEFSGFYDNPLISHYNRKAG